MQVQYCFTFFLITNAATEHILPDFITPCKRNDPSLNECYKKTFNDVMANLKDGIPSMNLRKVDPYQIEKLQISSGGTRTVSFNATLRDIQMYGMQNTRLMNNSIDFDNWVFFLDVESSNLFLTSMFKGHGRFLLIEANADGNWTANMDKLRFKGEWNAIKYEMDGKTHLRFEEIRFDVSIDGLRVHFENLLPNKEISARLNDAINSNIDIIYEELKPLVSETVNTIIVDAVNNVYKLFDFDTLFPIE